MGWVNGGGVEGGLRGGRFVTHNYGTEARDARAVTCGLTYTPILSIFRQVNDTSQIGPHFKPHVNRQRMKIKYLGKETVCVISLTQPLGQTSSPHKHININTCINSFIHHAPLHLNHAEAISYTSPPAPRLLLPTKALCTCQAIRPCNFNAADQPTCRFLIPCHLMHSSEKRAYVLYSPLNRSDPSNPHFFFDSTLSSSVLT
jgi:hypothetical protein